MQAGEPQRPLARVRMGPSAGHVLYGQRLAAEAAELSVQLGRRERLQRLLDRDGGQRPCEAHVTFNANGSLVSPDAVIAAFRARFGGK